MRSRMWSSVVLWRYPLGSTWSTESTKTISIIIYLKTSRHLQSSQAPTKHLTSLNSRLSSNINCTCKHILYRASPCARLCMSVRTMLVSYCLKRVCNWIKTCIQWCLWRRWILLVEKWRKYNRLQGWLRSLIFWFTREARYGLGTMMKSACSWTIKKGNY